MKYLLAVIAGLLLCAPALADEVVLRDGQVLRGEILAYDREAVVVRTGGIDYRVAAYAVERILLQQAYAPPLPSVAPEQVWAAGWADAAPYAYSGLAGVGELRRQMEVTGAVVNLRNGPGLEYAIIDRVARGDRLTAIAAVGGWYRLLRGDGTTAWISGELVRPLNVQSGVLQGAAGYGTAVTVPPVTAYAPAANRDPEYWRRRQYIEGLMRGDGTVPY